MNLNDRNRKRITKYLLYKLEYIYGGIQSIHISNRDTIEHILPKSPMNGSQWLSDFKPKEMEERLNKLGNLILLNENNNAKFGNFDFQEKRKGI